MELELVHEEWMFPDWILWNRWMFNLLLFTKRSSKLTYINIYSQIAYSRGQISASLIGYTKIGTTRPWWVIVSNSWPFFGKIQLGSKLCFDICFYNSIPTPSSAAVIEADASSSVRFFCTVLKASIRSPSSQSSNSPTPMPHSSPAFTCQIGKKLYLRKLGITPTWRTQTKIYNVSMPSHNTDRNVSHLDR